MSTDEFRAEQRSSVQITENAKGDPAITVKAYTHDLDALDAARAKAVEVYKATVQDVRGALRASVA